MITQTDREKLYEVAFTKWGMPSQMAMLAEECCELAKVALKYPRLINGTSKVDLIEEIADVEIMIEQVKHCLELSPLEIDKVKEIKLKRLSDILKEFNHVNNTN